MKRILASGSALALAGSGAIAFAGPLGAQEGEAIEELPAIEIEVRGAEVSPSTAAPGEDVTVTPTEPCDGFEGLPEEAQTLYWGVLDQGEFPGWDAYAQFDEDDKLPAWQVGEADLEEDGNWTVNFQAPPTAGNYEFVGVCPSDAILRDEDTTQVPEDEAPEEEAPEEGEGEGDGHGDHDHALNDGVELVSFPDTGDLKDNKRGWDWKKWNKKGDDKHGKRHHKQYRFWCGWKKPKHPKHPTTTTTEKETTTTTEGETTTTTEHETTTTTEAPTTTTVPDVPEDVIVGVYGPLDLVVEGGEAPPAPPITTQPSFTG